MAGFSITEAAFAGVGLVARKPLAALAWALVYVVFVGALLLVFGAPLVAFLAGLARQGATPAPGVVLGLIGGALGFFAVFFLGSIVLSAMVSCAVFRAVLEPENSSFFYLRLGASELWVMLVSFVQGIMMFFVQMLLAIPLGVAIALVGWPAHGGALGVAISIIGRLVVYGVTIWLYLRFSMTLPMTFADRNFRLFESWALTRGHAWSLFAVGLLIAIVSIIVYLILGVAGFASGLAILGVGVDALVTRPPIQWVRFFAPIAMLALTLLLIGGAILNPLFFAPWAQIYRRLRPEADVASTFT